MKMQPAEVNQEMADANTGRQAPVELKLFNISNAW